MGRLAFLSNSGMVRLCEGVGCFPHSLRLKSSCFKQIAKNKASRIQSGRSGEKGGEKNRPRRGNERRYCFRKY